MADKAESTREESMDIPEPRKPGVSEGVEDLTKSAQEILTALDDLGDKDPEIAGSVKELVKKLEEAFRGRRG